MVKSSIRHGGVRFPYEVFHDADYAKSGPVVTRMMTEEEMERYMRRKLDKVPVEALSSGKSVKELAKEYGVSERTVRRARDRYAGAGVAKVKEKVGNVTEIVAPVIKDAAECTCDAKEPLSSVEEYLEVALARKKAFTKSVMSSVMSAPLTEDFKRAVDSLLQLS